MRFALKSLERELNSRSLLRWILEIGSDTLDIATLSVIAETCEKLALDDESASGDHAAFLLKISLQRSNVLSDRCAIASTWLLSDTSALFLRRRWFVRAVGLLSFSEQRIALESLLTGLENSCSAYQSHSTTGVHIESVEEWTALFETLCSLSCKLLPAQDCMGVIIRLCALQCATDARRKDERDNVLLRCSLRCVFG